jgi:hypothetical protein
MPTSSRRILALALALAACSEESTAPTPAAATPIVYEPKITAELVPPAAKGLVLGVSTEKDVTEAFAPGEIVRDKSLGGTAKVAFSDKPAIMMELAEKDAVVKGEAWLVPDAKGEPRLARLELLLRTTDTCQWVEDNVGKHKAAKDRPGQGFVRRKYGPGEYTAGNADGTIPVSIECRASKKDDVAIEVLDYSIDPENGRSMMVNRNPALP